jgi:hypothetical protein
MLHTDIPHSSFSSDRLLDLKFLVPSPIVPSPIVPSLAHSPVLTPIPSHELPPTCPDIITTRLGIFNSPTPGNLTTPIAATMTAASLTDSNAPHPAVLTTPEQQVQSKRSHPANTLSPMMSTAHAACSARNASTAATAEVWDEEISRIWRDIISAPARMSLFVPRKEVKFDHRATALCMRPCQ